MYNNTINNSLFQETWTKVIGKVKVKFKKEIILFMKIKKWRCVKEKFFPL